MNVSIDFLLGMIGEREVQLQLLRAELAKLQAQLTPQTPESVNTDGKE